MEPVSIIALIVGAIAAIASTAVNASSVNKTNQANKDLAAQQNQWNIEQWARQNAYNDPSEQVKRLSGAGLNPALAYGQGGLIDAGNSSGNLQAAGATMQPFQMQDISHIGTDIMTAKSIEAQNKLSESQASNLDAQTQSIKEKLPMEKRLLEDTHNQITTQINQTNEDIKRIQALVKNLNQDTAKKAFETSDIIFQQTMADKKFQNDVKLLNNTLEDSKAMRWLNSQQAFYYRQLGNLTLEDVKFASQTLWYRVAGQQNEYLASKWKPDLAKNEWQRGEMTLQMMGFDFFKNAYDNPLTTDAFNAWQNGSKQGFGLKTLGDIGRSWSTVASGIGAPLRGIIGIKVH